MPILPFLKLGHPLLRQVSEPVDLSLEKDSVIELISNMTLSLDHEVRRLGLAAPQVGVLKRVVIFRIPKETHKRYGGEKLQEIPLTVLINPIIKPLSEEKKIGFEACISVPNMMGEVERYQEIEYTYLDLEGSQHTVQASGFHARVIQHECDHLDGILYPFRMKSLDRFGYEDEMIAQLG